jgi:molecular chaperone GrpE
MGELKIIWRITMSDDVKNNAQEEVNEQIDDEITEEAIPTVEVVDSEVEVLKVEVEKQRDLALRTMADMENLRRRSRIDVENAHKFGLEKFVNALIPVIDSMEMGLDASKKEDATVKSIQEGLEMIFKQTLDMLEKFSVERINPMGEKFDPKTQEAMTMVPSPDHESNTVMDVIQKGYVLNDRLVRAARVIVAQ